MKCIIGERNNVIYLQEKIEKIFKIISEEHKTNRKS